MEHKQFTPGKCRCGIELSTAAEQFLHECLHSEPYDPGAWNLSKMPYVNMPAAAKLATDFASYLMRQLAVDADEVLSEAREMLGVLEDHGGHDGLGGKGYLATLDHIDDLRKRCRAIIDPH